ncbi:MAG: hypothetical protein LC127_13745 [Chitinophagales bacterium]|nr:hypothetical protein [Chitinophagales bacterium]
MNNSNVPHLFIYDEGTAQNKDYFTYGEMNIIEKSLKKTTIINEYDDFLLQTEAVIQRLRPDKNGLIIYIHGYLGDNEFFMEKSGYGLHTQSWAINYQIWDGTVPAMENSDSVWRSLCKGFSIR